MGKGSFFSVWIEMAIGIRFVILLRISTYIAIYELILNRPCVINNISLTMSYISEHNMITFVIYCILFCIMCVFISSLLAHLKRIQ